MNLKTVSGTDGQDLLYTSGELPRLMQLAPPQRAVTAVWVTAWALDASPAGDR